jgi:hypothetical protein
MLPKSIKFSLFCLASGLAWVGTPGPARAQASLQIYSDHLVNGFQDWGWNSSRNFAATNPVYSGSYSLAIAITNAWGGMSFAQPSGFNTAPYTNISFWINGGTTGGQRLQVYATTNYSTVVLYLLPVLASNTWRHLIIPLAALQAARVTNCTGFLIQDATGGPSQPVFFMDDVQMGAAAAPALVHIGVNASQAIRAASPLWFGINNAIWDELLQTPGTISLLNEMGARALRFPGGSLSDEYDWMTDTSDSNTWEWPSPFSAFVDIATNLGAQTCITVNYGTGTPAEAAAWVSCANVTNHYAFKYWEIGNELYGSWETDTNVLPHDPYTYALRATNYIGQMKAADPTIAVGVVVTPGENSYANYTNRPAYNPRTGQTNYGWTPVLLQTLRQLGVTPDFAIHHRYPQNPGGESDPLLLQCSTGWAADAADLRQQITDYFGPGGTNIQLICTEHNSVSSAPGKQTTSLTSALFLADSFGQMMQTEFNGLFWFDFRNQPDAGNNNDFSLYGWRLYGDYGVVDGQTDRYPAFYAAKLLQHFIQGGDAVLAASSDYLLLSAYAARRADGSLALLVINKDPTAPFTAQIALTNFAPFASAVIRSYGVSNDNAMDTGVGSPDITETDFPAAAAAFPWSFAPYSLTLFTLAPAAPQLQVLPSAGGNFIFQLSGQAGAPCIIQTSSDLVHWFNVLTNTLPVTNSLPVASAAQFWRAVWIPGP